MMERIRRLEELEKRAQEEKREAEERLKKKLENKQKMKRCGGGFVVPFEVTKEELEEIKNQQQIQNFFTEEEGEGSGI